MEVNQSWMRGSELGNLCQQNDFERFYFSEKFKKILRCPPAAFHLRLLRMFSAVTLSLNPTIERFHTLIAQFAWTDISYAVQRKSQFG
jgi:hypothetical protein